MNVCTKLRPGPAPLVRHQPKATKLEAEPESAPQGETLSLSAITPANRALCEHLQVLVDNSARQVSSELLSLPASALMFHGTSVDFEAVEPRPSRRVSDGKVDWEGTAIFAAMDPRVALHYTVSPSSEVGTGIDLRNYTDPTQAITFYLDGGESLEDAMQKAYGDPKNPESCLGYVHLLEKSKFVREPGLGTMEMLSRDESANLGAIVINRREAIDHFVDSGRIKLAWSAR